MKTENKKNEQDTKSKNKKKKRSLLQILRDLLNGKFLTEDFIVKQSGLLFLIFCLIFIFISNRYYCSKKLTEMNNLKKELVRLQNEQVNLNFRLTKISRQAQIEELLKGKGIELTKENTVVYEIHK